MIPCKVFLEKLEVSPEGHPHKPKVNLILNSIFYDQIKPFQTKYFCLTANDSISLEVLFDQHENVAGKTTLQAPYKLALDNETISLTITNTIQSIPIKNIKVVVSLAPVTAYSRKKALSTISKNTGLLTQNLSELNGQRQQKNPQQTNGQLDISFSHRDPLLQTRNLNFQPLFPARDTTFNDSYRSFGEEGESLESLAQQRERILGQLFGRFKKDR